ncbi:DNA circularization N-terminal domain-containing protein, partial [archaeon]|nr:DNA circularization N-terminal domain-containing protein [archaeon]
MTDWRDGYREGSFRDVPFKTNSHQLTGGRRKQDREYAKRDQGNSEDLGKRLQKFTLEIFVLGDDYFSDRDALIKALETEGPGRLIHPYLGTISVQAGNYIMSETVGEGRVARFTVDFSESGQEVFPEEIVSDLGTTIARVDEESQNVFEVAFDVANQAAQVVQAAADGIDTVVDFMEDAIKKVTEPIANMTFAIRNIKASVNDLIQTPGILAERLSDMFGLLLDELSDDPDSASRILGQFANVDDEFVPVLGDTPSNVKQQGNQDATINIAKELALANNAQAAVDIDFISTNAALEKQREIVQGLDIQ